MNGTVIAVCGKGGVGKTSVSAVIASEVLRRGHGKALMVDADPSGGLGVSLGLLAERSINQIRIETIAEAGKKETDKIDLAGGLDYRLMEALTEKGNLAFLAIGRPADLGCYCSVNTLLREAIEKLAGGFEFTLIDAEAGIEQINRKVMRNVGYLMLVADPTVKALMVAQSIDAVFKSINSRARSGLLLNRIGDEHQVAELTRRTRLQVIGWIPEDETIRKYDAQNLSFFDLPSCPASRAILDAVKKAGLLL